MRNTFSILLFIVDYGIAQMTLCLGMLYINGFRQSINEKNV